MRLTILCSVLLLTILLAGCGQKEEAETPPTGPQTIASADGTNIVYETFGEGEVTVVLVHCWCCDRTFWENQIDTLSKLYHVVSLDLAGHGESDTTREAWTIDAYGQDVAAVVNHLNLDKVILVGHSMGGAVSLAAANLLGEKVVGIVGVDTFQDLVTEVPEEMKAQFLTPMRANFAGFTAQFVAMLFAPDTDSALKADIATEMSSAPPEVGIGSFESLMSYDTKGALVGITAPIVGINSDMRPVNEAANAEAANDYRLVIMPGVGHFPHLEKPAEFNEIFLGVLEELTAPAAH